MVASGKQATPTAFPLVIYTLSLRVTNDFFLDNETGVYFSVRQGLLWPAYREICRGYALPKPLARAVLSAVSASAAAL